MAATSDKCECGVYFHDGEPIRCRLCAAKLALADAVLAEVQVNTSNDFSLGRRTRRIVESYLMKLVTLKGGGDEKA